MIQCKREIQKALGLTRVAKSRLEAETCSQSNLTNHWPDRIKSGRDKSSNAIIEFPVSSLCRQRFAAILDRPKQLLDELSNHVGHLSYITRLSLSPDKKNGIQITIDRNAFVEQVLRSTVRQPEVPLIPSISDNQTSVIEFSSPNIAKPFHCGHFRSTILGNFVSNLCSTLGHRVRRLNYLGDWGTQFGLLAVGFDRWGDPDRLQQNALDHLLQVYVQVCRESESPEAAGLRDLAKQSFSRLESGLDAQLHERWKLFRSLSLTEYEKQYERLGIQFDQTDFESQYRDMGALKQLVQQFPDLFQIVKDGAIVFRKSNNDPQVPLVKSDGSSLYLSRDVLAAIDRFNRYSFDNMFYVVDNAQRTHFHNLKSVLALIGCEWSSRLQHIAYGRISGMSTRKGTVVLLQDILNEAKQLAIESTRNTKTSKLNENELEQVGDVLGMSCLIVNDFKRRRVSNYAFDWNVSMDQRGDSGISLQYAHSRLNNLKLNCGIDCDRLEEFDLKTIDWSSIDQPETLDLAVRLSQYDEVLEFSNHNLEPFYILNHLFSLSKGINKAYKVFQVKNQSDSVARTRLLLFHCAQNLFKHEMKVLGMQPLDKI